jgi:glycosyltransferase involved in cell wall biosynthesis
MEQRNSPGYILITSTNFPHGGAGAAYLNLFCRGLKNSGANIRVLLLKGHAFGDFTYKGPRKNVTVEGIPFIYLGFTQRPRNVFLKISDELFSLVRLMAFLLTLKGKSKSVSLLVYNSDLFYNIPIHLMSKIFNVRLIKFVAEFIDKSEFGRSLIGILSRSSYYLNYKYLNKLSTKLIVFSYFLKDVYSQLGYNESNIIVQPNLTDFDFWKTDMTESRYTLGYSGAPYLKDGLSDLFNSISLLKNEANMQISLLVIGDAVFGESLIPSLKEECTRLGISEQVVFTGLVESNQVKNSLADCEILAITRPCTVQTKSGFPTKLGEYFATGKPVLATDFGDMKIYFKDGWDITMAECGNAGSIAEKIKWMVSNPNKLSEIADRGYNRALKLLEYQNSVRRIANQLG